MHWLFFCLQEFVYFVKVGKFYFGSLLRDNAPKFEKDMVFYPKGLWGKRHSLPFAKEFINIVYPNRLCG